MPVLLCSYRPVINQNHGGEHRKERDRVTRKKQLRAVRYYCVRHFLGNLMFFLKHKMVVFLKHHQEKKKKIKNPSALRA